jgi:hypothetical protein
MNLTVFCLVAGTCLILVFSIAIFYLYAANKEYKRQVRELQGLTEQLRDELRKAKAESIIKSEENRNAQEKIDRIRKVVGRDRFDAITAGLSDRKKD